MKGNNGSGNNESRDTWETPKGLFEVLNAEYHFTFDCCATPRNTKTLAFAYDFEQHDLTNTGRTCWMNPPFSKAYDMFNHFFNAVDQGVAIYRCDNLETNIWQDLILLKADWIFIPKGRVVYEGLGGNGARFPSALIGKGVKPPTRLKGKVLKLK